MNDSPPNKASVDSKPLEGETSLSDEALRKRNEALSQELEGLRELNQTLKDSGQAFFDAQTTPVRFIGTLMDITERKLSEQSIHRREIA